jgi:hypothetical protein
VTVLLRPRTPSFWVDGDAALVLEVDGHWPLPDLLDEAELLRIAVT